MGVHWGSGVHGSSGVCPDLFHTGDVIIHYFPVIALALSCSLSGSFRLASVHCGVVILTCVIVSTHICLSLGSFSWGSVSG